LCVFFFKNNIRYCLKPFEHVKNKVNIQPPIHKDERRKATNSWPVIKFWHEQAKNLYNKRSALISVNLWLSNYSDISKYIGGKEKQ